MESETANAQDARVDALWATLDTRDQGQLDLVALKRGLRKMDHRMARRSCWGLWLMGSSAEKCG